MKRERKFFAPAVDQPQRRGSIAAILSAPGRRLVWVVDDSPLDADRARRVLATEHEVATFPDGSAALERVAAGNVPDILVLDWVMPGVSGPEVCRFLRSSLIGARIGILLLTAHKETAQIVEGLEAGANDFLSKPWEDAELRARVASLVRTRELIERVERAERRALRVFTLSPDPLLAVDGTGHVALANDEAAKLLGRDPRELTGHALAELVPGLDTAEVTTSKDPRALRDVRIGERIFSPTARLVEDEAPARTIVSLRDVTDRRLADSRRVDFLSIVAHDLRSPLGAVLMRAELLLRGKHGVLPAAALADIQRMDKGIKALVALINDFLDFTRLESGGYKLERVEVDLAALVDDVMTEVQPLIEANGLRWLRERDGPACVLGDRRRLAQVVTNLASNAIKFTPPGGQITTRVERTDGGIVVSVADTGRGVPPEIATRLFERYVRATAHEHEIAGTGLGLMIVREIVEAHGGEVGVESEPGQGSKFWFRVPRALVRGKSA
jgi:signal transduction histidine kinase